MSIDGQRFRELIGHFPTGVTAIRDAVRPAFPCLGRVLARDVEADSSPLVFFRGGYRAMAHHIPRNAYPSAAHYGHGRSTAVR